MSQMPNRDSQPSAPQQPEGLEGISATPEAPTSKAPDPKDILKAKLQTFRGLDEQITSISMQSEIGKKYGAQVQNLLKAWMMEEVKNTQQPQENPRILGAS